MTAAYKILTHDYRPPAQGGEPLFDGVTPHQLPIVAVDESSEECAAGWNACRDLATAIRIGGHWPDGRPCSAWIVADPIAPVVERADKIRAASWTIARRCTEEEIAAAVRVLSAPFGEHAEDMCAAQLAWRTALGRPLHDEVAVETGLRAALAARGLDWSLRRYDTARDVWAARDARDARAAWDGWDAWDAWDARDARDARAAWAAWDARAARDARNAWAAWDAWDAWAARDARNALTVQYATQRGWVAIRLTTGLREAYQHGLEVAVHVDLGVLGWVMDAR